MEPTVCIRIHAGNGSRESRDPNTNTKKHSRCAVLCPDDEAPVSWRRAAQRPSRRDDAAQTATLGLRHAVTGQCANQVSQRRGIGGFSGFLCVACGEWHVAALMPLVP